jgi:hypothetical protein
MSKPLVIWERNFITMHPYSPPIDILIRDVLQHHSDVYPEHGLLQSQAEHLADSHPLKQQALVVMDAIESVTNGMENPDVFDKLSDIPQDSPFQAWVSFISAVQAFYRGDAEEMTRKLDEIPSNSPPKALDKVLRHLSSIDSYEKPLKGIERQLIQSVGNPGGVLSDTLLLISEALEQNQEEIFSDAVAYLAKELYGSMPDLSKRLFLWAFSVLSEKGWSEDIISAHGRLIFGVPESERLRSLSFFDTAPEEALVHWSRYRGSVTAEISNRQGVDTDALRAVEVYLSAKIKGAGCASRADNQKQRPVKKPVQLELFA